MCWDLPPSYCSVPLVPPKCGRLWPIPFALAATCTPSLPVPHLHQYPIPASSPSLPVPHPFLCSTSACTPSHPTSHCPQPLLVRQSHPESTMSAVKSHLHPALAPPACRFDPTEPPSQPHLTPSASHLEPSPNPAQSVSHPYHATAFSTLCSFRCCSSGSDVLIAAMCWACV